MYTVDEYLGMMEAADRAPSTIKAYRVIFESFGKFLGVPVEEIHNHLSSENLIKYAASTKGYSGLTVRQRLSILRAYFTENGVEFKNMQMKVLNARRRSDPDDKPLDLVILQKMMDLADPRGKAFIAVGISTGMRGGELSNLRLQDVKGNVITIPGAIAKNKRGGKVYLTAEAREYLDIWLKNRDEFIRLACIHGEVFRRKRASVPLRPENDDRLFASAYTSLNMMFKRLYRKVDGEKGKYRSRITPHSMRKYFRTHAVKTMDLDIVERLMRHSGYLSSSYVRMTDEQVQGAFHKGEHVLYITRAEHRMSSSEINGLRRDMEQMRAQLAILQRNSTSK